MADLVQHGLATRPDHAQVRGVQQDSVLLQLSCCAAQWGMTYGGIGQTMNNDTLEGRGEKERAFLRYLQHMLLEALETQCRPQTPHNCLGVNTSNAHSM